MKALLFFLVNPLIGFINAMKNLDRRLNGLVFIMFYALFGYAISFNLITADSYRIAARFCSQDFDFRMVWALYKEGRLTDVYLLFMYGVIQLFTRNPKVLYGILGAVMGAFSYMSIKQVFLIWRGGRNKYFYILVFFFFLAISFFNVNGIRFWTATSWFSYFAIRYLYFDKKRAIIGVLVTPLIHFGYFIGVVGILIFAIIHKLVKNTSFYYLIMILAFGVNLLTPQSALDDIMGAEGDADEFTSSVAINRKANNYRKTTENIEKKEASRAAKSQSLYRQANYAFTTTFDYVNKFGMMVMLTALYRRRKKIIQDKTQQRFLHYVMFSFALGFIATLLIGSGGRFIRLANMMYVFWLLTVFRSNATINPIWKRYVKLLFLFNFYALSFLFFNAPRLVTPLFWFAPPVFTIIDGIGFAPIDFV
jgi:hypothetical protein